MSLSIISGTQRGQSLRPSKTTLRLALDEITARAPRHYGSCPTRLRLVVLTLLMLVVGVGTSWGQTGTDYSGTYYIASDYHDPNNNKTPIYNPTTLTNNFYLCPTEGWISFGGGKEGDNTKDTWTTGDNKPFLTTYQARLHANDANDPYNITKAKWTIEYYTTESVTDYYYFKHSSGKYLVLNKQIDGMQGSSPQNRIRVHLETLTSEQLAVEATRNLALFTITQDGRSIYICPKTQSSYHLTVNNGNGDYLQGKGKNDNKGYINDGGTKYEMEGTIGIYGNSNTDDNKYLYLEDYITRPTITYNDANDEITITAVQPGATLIYTTDGSTPTTSNGTPVNNTTITFNPADGETTIKAVAVVNGELSNIATFTTPFYIGSNRKYLIQSQNNAWNTTDFHFYMIPGDEDNSVIKLNTTSLFRPTMEWYFLNADVENDVQYYYIVNNSAKDNSNNPYYLCYDATNKVYMETYSEDNKFKFSIVESPTAGTFNIIPYGLSSGDRFVFKSSGNANANAIGLTNSNTSENARWKFIASNALDKNAPYSASNATSSSYYKIASVGDNTYYIVPPSGNNTNATASNSNDVALVKSGIWFFEVAQEADASDWCTYYYIRNAETGKYLYFTKDDTNYASDPKACLIMKSSIEIGEEDCYMFTWARTATNGTYYIVPKKLKDAKFNLIGTLQRNGTTLQSNMRRDAGNYAWTFETSSYKCETPVINYNALTGTISITCGTPDATIYVAHYNSEPSSSDIPELIAGNVYSDEFDALPGYYKAVASRSTGGDDMSDAATSELIEEFHCTRPIITKQSDHVTITCATPGATIYYIAGSGEFSENAENYGGTLYTESGFDTSETVIKAIAVKGGVWSTKSAEALYDKTPITITSGAQITNMDGVYVVGDSFTPSSSPIGSATDPFTGEFDGNFKTFELSHPLFAYVSGATIKNVIISNANNISTSANAGVIANVASGDTRIYNCGINSGSVSGSNNVGGIVGSLDGSSRVINCYSYANITGGTNKGGIVGYNSYASKSGDIRTMVMNCMFYGDISSGGTISPIYGGELIDNQKTDSETGLNNYNYYRYESDYSYDNLINKYNNALAAKEEYLNRFEFYRQMMNSNKKLAAYYATGSANNADQKMAKWVLETADRSNGNPYPYPILKPQDKYPSIINYDTNNLADYAEDHRKEGRKTGELSVTINYPNGGWTNAPTDAKLLNQNGNEISTSRTISLVRTDKDEDRFNFNYDKVQLPYYNDYGTKNYTGNKVVTGWKITGVTIGSGDDVATQGSYSASDSWGGYNFADRKTYAKDLYSVSGRVFSQGAYFDVPYGATAITIEPYWGNAAYISDEKLDVVYKSDYTTPTDILESQFSFNNGTATGAFNGQNVYSNINTALGTLSGSTVYDNALVLVGNRHLSTVPASDSKHFTIMSVDEDHDNEPDYSLIYHHNGRAAISPIRLDFLNVMGTAQAQKPREGEKFFNVGIFKPKGWFEITNTCIIYFSQIEYDNGGKVAEPLILLGGVVDQIVSNHEASSSKTTTYIHLGSNVRFKQFSNGCHSDRWDFTKHIPVSVTGGDYEEFYLSGMYRPDAQVITNTTDNAECYISGGRFGELAGAGQQMINGNVQWQIYNADIENFYGGGINAAKPITGDITVNLYNSHIGTYCGGPKFGNMQKAGSITVTWAMNKEGTTTDNTTVNINADRIVKTNATGCTFGTYFGAGYGGTSYNRVRTQDAVKVPNNFWEGDYTGIRGNYLTANIGIATDFDYDFFVWSSGETGGRFYVKYASLSTAQTNNVTSTLTNCIVNGNVYGGGKLGRVAGKASTTLNGCTVNGDVFGAGYSGTLEPVKIRDGGFGGNPVKYPSVNTNSGMFEDGEFSGTTDYIWKEHALTDGASNITTENGTNYIYTDVDLDVLGQVDDAELIIQGNTTSITGSVYGGGEEADVNIKTTVDISGGTVSGNVYGGGNLGDVGTHEQIQNDSPGNYNWKDTDGNDNGTAPAKDTGVCTVTISGGTIGTSGVTSATSGNVFGAGKGATSSFFCEKGMVYKTDVSITKGTVYGNVYGGGQLGRVENNTTVTIGAPSGTDEFEIKGGVFGAGAGVATHGYSALVRGNSTVTVQGKAKVGMNVYGGGETASVGRFRVENSLPKEPLSGGTCTVTIQGDARIGTGNAGGSVYGACKGVEPDYANNGSAGHVINTGASVPFTDEDDYLAFLKTLALTSNTIVTIDGSASVNGSVYGGGRRGITLGGVQVSMTGGTVNQDVYGGGALADTNTGNWNADYGSVAGITTETIVTGYYTRSGEGTTDSPYVYTEITEANRTAAENTTYYSRNSWAHATLKSAYYTTTVNLTSGIIRGDVYGGGLGRQAAENVTAVEATVYGDVTVNLNDNNGTCYVNGSVFGCNNTNGSPKGDVEVHIYNTVHLDGNNVVTTDPGTSDYELKAVYGGGKKAEYNGTDRTAKVYIETCDPSIEEVYGGGFGADVPNTYVEVKGAHEIHYVFGGGYGADTQGFTNPGANVNGTTEVLLKGGTVHEVYGGSNTKGNITGGTNVNVSDESNENCPLTVEHIYGGGKNANMSGSANIILGCQPDAWIEDIYAGSREADVEGDVSLTITSGKFERVFGGNKTSGKLKGSITVNIEETGDCSTPIIIGELYAGGNEAHYSIYGYKDNGDPMTADELRTKLTTDNPGMTAEQIEALFQATKKVEPQLNVRAFTSIGAIYGGGYSAEMYADPTVSINVVKGSLNTTVVNDNQYTPSAAPFHHLPYPAHASGAIGTIGNVFGGGNLATVHGSTTVNIGTESHIYFKTEPTHLGTKGTDYIEQADGSFRATVEGANITGNVYGGGNLADVTGNTQINVCAVYDEENDKYDPVAEGASKVTIGGDIFGGGKGEADNFFCDKAMVGTDGAGADAEHYPNYADGNTTIIIGNGTVNGNVYGGGEVGRVEMNTSVTVGLGDGVASGGAVTSAPEIIHSVFGGGKGVKTHGYSALVRGNPTVTIQGNAKVRDNVYGGGEIASVARYNVPRTQAQVDAAKALGYDAVLGMPYALKDVNSGSCTVTIQGYAEIGPETIGSDNTTSIGHVFGAGKGIVPGGTYAYQQGTTKRMVLYDGDVHTAANTHWEYVDPTHSDTNKNVWEKFADEAAYITFVQTLALSSRTNVTIDGNAKVKGSVFGGSESGFVQFNTNVNVEGGTIGVEGKGGADFGNVYGGGKGDVVSTGENENYVAAGIVKGNTKVLVSQASGKTTKIYHNVYGGGAYGTVGEFVYGADGLPTGLKTYTVGETVQTTEGGKTEIYITGGTIGTNGDENGMIFGSSRGDVGAPGSIHDKAAWVYDTHVAIGDTTANATITTTTPLIKGSVYGGGENGHNFHNAYVRINGGTIGITEGENLTYTENGQSVTKGGAAYPYRGNVYGGGCGTDKYNNNTLYNPLAGIVQGNAIVNITAGNVVHNVYGAGAMGSVGRTVTTNGVTTTTGGKTTISIGGGTIGVSGTVGDGNIFGAARGNLSATGDDLARVRETSVTVSNGTVKGNVYGGGQLGDVGTIDKTDQTNYNYTWKKSDGNNNTANNNKITSHNTNTGICTVTISGGTIGTGVNPSSDGTYANGNVFGAGKGDASTWWCERAIAYATNVSVTKGTVYGNVYGGGELGRVEDDAKVTIGTTSGSEALTITGSVYGAGAGIKTHGYSALVRGNSDVLVQGVAQIGGSVYGGGEIASVGRFKVIDGLPSKPQAGGTCTVTIQGSAKIGTSGTEHNVFGACKGVTPTYNNTLNDANRTKSMQLYANRPKDANGNELAEHTYWDYYETYPNNYAGPKFVWVYYPKKEDYLDFLRTLALTSNTHVTIGGSAEVHGSVFGGGERGVTLGSVDVNMTGGTVFQDVYGGGSLADSNRAMWDATNHKRYDYVELIELIDGLSVVTGYYTKSGDTYTLTNDVTAQSGTTYYAKYKTNVNLTGGMIKGDAYGGGLGQLGNDPIEAMVYGDVSVNQGTLNDESAATAYTISYLTDNSEPAKQVVNSGRIFGCNNLNGSPKGNVTVTVYGTVTGKDASGNNIDRTNIIRDQTTHVVTSVPTTHTYEVAAVYGGGNLADYAPADGDVKVRISSCNVSIEEVYGGGNAARVPSTDVLVTGAHEIEHVFGGGNGEDKYYLNGEWHENPGADIDGDANTLLKGGLIHEAYGGSNEKGTITGDITIDTGTGGLDDCPVKVDKLVGAGKNADVNGNLIIVLGCYPTTKTPLIFAGADNANVNGDVELTITSGTFGKVFGGNNEGGAIKGHIILNIEETGCNPINIDELYLGGNEAAYSRYGYYLAKDNNGHQLYRDEEQTKPLLRPRTSATDEHMPVQLDDTEYTNISDFEAYAQPVLNVVSCTSIGEVFGGGYGEGGTMYADPTVNINMIPGEHATALGDANNLGAIGNVYGGGNAAAVYGDATVNIGTEGTVLIHKSYDKSSKEYDTESKPVTGANITGNVYGGGKKADVGKTHLDTNNGSTIDVIDLAGNTFVNICAKYNTTSEKWESVTEGTAKVKIGGSVFGGGEGEAIKPAPNESVSGAFRCGKAMVTGSTNVMIGNGTVTGSVYGGGEIGRVEKNTAVTIGIKLNENEGASTTVNAPNIRGDVFGAGKGVHSHGYAALVRGNTNVIVQGNAKVGECVYGGGKIASVGRYNIADSAYHASHPKIDIGMPYSLANDTSGNCVVIVRDNAEVGPDNMQMKKAGGPDDTGYVFGAGKGILPYEGTNTTDNKPGRVKPDNTWQDYSGTTAADTTAYLRFIETQGLATQTDVTITGNAFIKGSVYGGSFNGHVQHNTHVTIAGDCQIGQGEGITERYKDHYGAWPTDASEITTSWKECAHWDYDPSSGAPFDMYAIYKKTVDGKDKYYYDEACTKYAEGGRPTALDGHTYYGNVFGGGSGYIPYAPGKWHREAGSVGGNTQVDITGGHILTSVYGGNEQTDVGTYQDMLNTIHESGGKCTINMTGGTIGVPRTVEDMMAHPVTCYLFGAGKGDQRIFFNTWTNVMETEVNISGDARIYGSVFGGGEDGHVIGNANTNIGGTVTIGNQSYTPTDNLIIGTTGTSYVDGNVFGGGRGFSGEAQTAGSVGGNVTLMISGGTMLGSIYGGGRLASVGTQFTAPNDPNYGNFLEDNGDKTYGHVTINISGGTIGNDLETKEGDIVKDKIYSFNLETSGLSVAQIDEAKKAALQTLKVAGKIPVTDFELYDSTLVENSTTQYTYYYRASHTKGGNVFGGSMGRLDLLDGTRNPIWPKMARVKTSEITISGDNTRIKRSVYGGGEMGTVRDNAKVTINNGTIWRDVYGGGYGSEDRQYTIFSVKEPKPGVTNPSGPEDYNTNTYAFTPMQFAGCVGKGTIVDISGGYVWKSVYGGGEMASVGIFDSQVEEVSSEPSEDKIVVGQKNGKWSIYSNMIKHWDVNNEFALSWPYEFTYLPIYPGTTQVNVTGGRIGLKTGDGDINSDNGDVCGGGKGLAGDYNDYVFCANVGSSEVNINYTSSTATIDNYETEGDCITGAVYGGAENGHVMGNTKLTLKNGLVGHSIYGGGSGKGQFNTRQLKIGKTPGSTNNDDYYKRAIYSITAGKVFGNTEVLMEGGRVVRNVYGGGNMGSVGKGNYAGGPDDYSTAGYGEKLSGSNNLWDGNNKYSQAFLNSGKCKVKITGGTIGYIDESDPSNSMYPWNSTASLPYGNVFGGCRGESAPNISESPRYLYSPEFFVGYANETEVTIEGNSTKILGSVYGGGMDGHVRRDASVTINGGEIGIPYNEANINKVQTDDLNNIQWLARGNVYGAGSGIGKYKYDFNYDNDTDDTVTYNDKQTKEEDYSTSAGSVTRFTTVTINGGTIHRNVYGGGSLASVGQPKIPVDGVMPADPIRRDDNAIATQGKQSLNEVTITEGNIGDATSFAAGYGGYVFGASRGDETLDNPSSFAKAVWTDVNVAGGTILGDVYGGGEVGTVRQGTEVDLTGGTIDHDVFGGGKGTSGENGIAADVGGDVLVTLNGTRTASGEAPNITYSYNDNAVVKGSIFGANNVKGTPKGHVTVHVYKTTPASRELAYDVTSVFGGGKQADYVPTDTVQSTEVIIEGCDQTSIQEVYGGGYGAAVPATSILVKGTKIINEVFGGGYGAGENNPGANVGYLTGGTSYTSGSGKAIVQLMAGKINDVYGGSNTKGDIRGGSSIKNVTNEGSSPECCAELEVGNIYGGGKDAEMTGGTEIVLGCMPNDWIDAIYAGAENADVGNDVSLTLTSGKFGRVFGGNKSGGRLSGGIEVNIEENGSCEVPLIIGELYGGGMEAPYSIYGYKGLDTNGKGIPRTVSDYNDMTTEQKEAEGIKNGPNHDPRVNVRAFTSIGNIFGGGYGSSAVMVGNPTVNIDEVAFDTTAVGYQRNAYDPDKDNTKPALIDGVKVKLYPHANGAMGVIGNVFGGGNEAEVIGNTQVNVATNATVKFVSTDATHDVVGADIKGNVYGGGNNAKVTGNTNVVIGREKVIATTP